MFFYLIHSLPIGKDLPDGTRNTRTFFFGLICYIILHAMLYSNYVDSYPMLKLVRDYFYYFLFADVFAVAILYKLRYGRSILRELSTYETDKYDPTTKKYIPHNATNMKQNFPQNDIYDQTEIPIYQEPTIADFEQQEPLEETRTEEEKTRELKKLKKTKKIKEQKDEPIQDYETEQTHSRGAPEGKKLKKKYKKKNNTSMTSITTE
jgi:hypothetical protein